MPFVVAIVILFLMSNTDPVIGLIAALILVVGAIVYSREENR